MNEKRIFGGVGKGAGNNPRLNGKTMANDEQLDDNRKYTQSPHFVKGSRSSTFASIDRSIASKPFITLFRHFVMSMEHYHYYSSKQIGWSGRFSLLATYLERSPITLCDGNFHRPAPYKFNGNDTSAAEKWKWHIVLSDPKMYSW